MVKVTKHICLLSLISIFSLSVFAANDSALDSYTKGLNAYKNNDWTSASLLLHKAAAFDENSNPDLWYMIIMSQIYSENYSQAVSDCDYFISEFSDSSLLPYVEYQKGRVLYFLGQSDSAALILSDFCHQNPGDKLYPSALFWLAQCFFDDYNFDIAKSLYERIVNDFPNSSKFEDAKFRLELITQREREQKLLYLLKMTGEEYLSSREDFEKQIREYQTEDLVSLRKQLKSANQKIQELEDAVKDIPSSTPIYIQKSPEQIEEENELSENILLLKAKASLVKALVESKKKEQ